MPEAHSPDPDTAAITEILYTKDVAAFVAQDWAAVADDFDAARFVGYSAADDGTWRITFPTLEAYRRSWLEQARELSDAPRLAVELAAAQRLASITVSDDHALVRKEFDGAITAASGSTTLEWTTYYFLNRAKADAPWRITGFVGYLPATRKRSDT